MELTIAASAGKKRQFDGIAAFVSAVKMCLFGWRIVSRVADDKEGE
jgi:hypothetical protein